MPGYIQPTPEFEAPRVIAAFVVAANLPGTGQPPAASPQAGVLFRRSELDLRALLIELDAVMRRGEPAPLTLARIATAVAKHPILEVLIPGSPGTDRARAWTQTITVFAAWELVDEQARRDGRRLGVGARQDLIRMLREGATISTISKMIERALEPMPALPNIVFIQPAEALPDHHVQAELARPAARVRRELRPHPVRVREPLPQYDPAEADDRDPRTIFGAERPRLLDADLLVVLLDNYNSPGCHKAIEWLQSLGTRVLVFSSDGSGGGRGTGRGPFTTEYFVDLDEDEIVAKVLEVYNAEQLDLQAHAADRMRARRQNSRIRAMLADALSKRPNPPIGITEDRIRELLRDVSEFETLSTEEWRRLIAYAGPAIVSISDLLLGIDRQANASAPQVKAPEFVLERLVEARDAIAATDAEVDFALAEMMRQFERELLVGNPDPWKTFTRKWFIDVIMRYRGHV